MKEITDKLNCIKIKNFCSSKTLLKTEDRERKNICIYISGKRLFSETRKELLKLHDKKANNPIKKWAKDLSRRFTKENIEMASVRRERLNIIRHQGIAD